MKIKIGLFVFIFSLIGFSLIGQRTQTIRGIVIDHDSKYPLIGVNVTIGTGGDNLMGASTDTDGGFRINNVPVGRHDLIFSYLGYQEIVMNNISVTSAKEVLLTVEMEEAPLKLEEVTIVAKRNGEVVNEMAMVSAREFTVSETNRYAGSRGEPARMASNYAGVQGADDSRNDIVVRGNSPTGVLWRLEGINIPNPNHFSIPGTGGGPVTILNNKFLSNSEFYTGAFPAEYSNGIAGVFDLKMRNGNNEKHEFSGQLGFLGTELTAEGPINKQSKSSYLAMYRYSTLQLFQFMGIQVGTDAIPQYQDGAFRLNFPQKHGGNIAFFGMGGTSTIDIILSELEKPDTSTLIYGDNERDQYFTSRMGVVGLSYSKPINRSTFMKATLSASQSRIDAHHDLIVRHVDENNNFKVDSLPPMLNYFFQEDKYSANIHVNKRVNSRLNFKFGATVDLMHLQYQDSARLYGPNFDYPDNIDLNPWLVRWYTDKFTTLYQGFVQFKYHHSEKLSFTGGINTTYFDFNKNSFSPVEPRLGIAYQMDKKQKLSLGLGLHSQMISPYIFYYSNQTIGRDPQEYNLDLGFIKSAHAVLSYDRYIAKNMRVKAETYYQYLYDIPVELTSSSYSLINAGSGFSRFFPNALQNEGIGRNYGLELTIEKFFSKGYYYLFTGSIFDAKYQGSDKVWRNTTFNGKYTFNALFAKEFNLGKNSAVNIGGKVTYAGGRWYGDVDDAKSKEALEVIFKDETVNTKQFSPYFRTDFKVNYVFNAKRFTHELAVDLINVFATKNILTLTYAPDHPSGNPIVEEYQLGFFPVFYYKIDF